MRRLVGAVLAGAGVALLAGWLVCVDRVRAEDRAELRFGQQEAPVSTAPTIQVYSRETIVDVTVTDKDGKPVHGLTRADFTVKEDGKPQAIKSFAEFGAAAPADTHELPKLPPNVYTNLQPPASNGALNIILLDFVNAAPVLAAECCTITPCPFEDITAHPQDVDAPTPAQCSDPSAGAQEVARAVAAQQRVKQAAINYLQHMPAGTRVEVLGMSWPGHIRVLQGFTSDAALLSAAVNTMSYDTDSTVAAGSPDPVAIVAKATNDPVLRSQVLNKLVPDSGSDATNALIGGTLYEQICQQADGRDRMTLEALQQIAADLMGIKGKKNLIWFTVGTPYITDPGTRPGCLPDYSVGLTRAYSLLTTAQIALYPVDARGIMTAPDDVLELSGKLILNVHVLSGKEHADAVTQFGLKTAAEQLSMENWAEKTGGEAFYNTNDLAEALARAMDAGANYYTLSYIPPGEGFDGRYHSIKVSVNQPGLRLVYRTGYAAEDPSTFKPTPGLTLAATSAADSATPIDMRREMTRSMPASQQLLFDVQMEPSSEPAKAGDPAVFGVLDVNLKGKPLTRYGFTYALPGRQIALTDAPNGLRHGGLEFDLAAYDADGNVVTSSRQAIDLNLTAEQAAQLSKSPFRYFQQLDLPAGTLFVRVGVLDRAANRVGTLEIAVTVAKPEHTAAK